MPTNETTSFTNVKLGRTAKPVYGFKSRLCSLQLIAKLGGKPDNKSVTQLAELFTSAPQVNTGIMRDAAGRAKVAAPVAADDIARKAETDAEAKARLQAVMPHWNHLLLMRVIMVIHTA